MGNDNNVGKKVVLGALIAGAVGYVAGVLTAPKSGKDTRKDIANKAGEIKSDTEAAIKKLQNEIDEQLASIKAQSAKLGEKAKQELNEATEKAKNAKNKSAEVVKALRAGEAGNPELDAAVKQLKEAKTHLGKFIKS